ncbi:hypothetical protein [Roseomonas populi]|uniref:DUF4153 domain-containing protein n=1 Tax=Roseomonas populi TaxID=3121582 RepID=A0ABT1XBE0_9PROT|nr:hypothetical protein [Roseomonas pecuniae]MCR0985066.1 hypothetical protein [Roseomonas pecuniae]
MPDPVSPAASRALIAARLGIGLAQGVALRALSAMVEGAVPHPWAAANPKGFGLLVLLAALLPLPVLLGLGHIRGRALAAWTLASAALILLLGGHDLRQHGELSLTPASNALMLSLGGLLFIGQALMAAADAGRRWWPRYPDLFEAAWRTGMQLALALAFVLGFWLIYWIGSMLFSGIGIKALRDLGGRSGFVIPVTTALGAAGIHLADSGGRLTRGLRALLLALGAWLAPPAAGLAAAFLLSLPFTGLEVFRGSEAASWLTAAAAGLVVLINAVHGDGGSRGEGSAALLLGLSARLSAVLLPVLVALAALVLARTVGSRGLTEMRVEGAAVLALLAAYAVAYAFAARRPAMRAIEPANTTIALLAIPVLVALNTPLADPARLTAESQTGRLLRGEVAPDDFDFYRLGKAGHSGGRALAALARHPDPEIARRADAALPRPETPPPATLEDAAEAPLRLRALPDGTALPPGLAEAMMQVRPECVEEECVARLVELEGQDTWLVGPVYGGFRAMRAEGAGWRLLAIFNAPLQCRDAARAGLRAGPPNAAPWLPALELGGVVLRPVLPRDHCR